MDLTTVITAIIGGLFGTGLGAFLTYRLGSRKQNTTELELVLKERKEIEQSLRSEISQLKERVYELEERSKTDQKEIASLQTQQLIFESSHTDIPLPIWLKDTSGKMIFLNAPYEELFLSPRGYTIHDYIGNTDFAVWPEEVAVAFQRNDKQVMLTKKPYEGVEMLVDKNGTEYYVDFIKWPRFFEKKVIGIAGLVRRQAMTKEELLN